jgi:hypothetical protein
MAVFFPVAAASGQIFIVEFGVFCCRFFFYHETLSNLSWKRIKVFASVEHLCPWRYGFGHGMATC